MKTNKADLVQHVGEIEYIFCRPKIKKICMHPKFLPKTFAIILGTLEQWQNILVHQLVSYI